MTHAYLRPADHADIVDGYLKMPHVLSFVQIRQMGVLLSSSVVCTFFMRATTDDVIPMIRQWFDHSDSNRVHSGS